MSEALRGTTGHSVSSWPLPRTLAEKCSGQILDFFNKIGSFEAFAAIYVKVWFSNLGRFLAQRSTSCDLWHHRIRVLAHTNPLLTIVNHDRLREYPMRSGLFIIILIWVFQAGTAQAGAWLRKKGSSFTSAAYTTTWFGDRANTSYLEYGLRDDLTIGADIGYGTSRHGTPSGYGTLFLRRPLGRDDGPDKWAYEIGVGGAWVDGYVLPHVRTGLSWGRGIKLRERYGWVAVDASMTWDITSSLHLAKLDSTLGFNFTEVTAGMIQIYLAHVDHKAYASIAPSLLIRPLRGGFRIQLGAETPLGYTKDTAIKIGLWQEF